jgi:hypothetical protein
VIVYRTREDWFITNRILAGDVTTTNAAGTALAYGENWREFPTSTASTNSTRRNDIQAGTGDGYARFDHTAQASDSPQRTICSVPHIQITFCV